MSLHSHPFQIPQLGNRQRTVRIYLPPAYERSTRHFPVLYALDGQNLFEAHTAFGGRHWQIPEKTAKLPAKLHTIVVGLDNGGAARVDEYAPYRRGHHGGEGDATVHFLMETLKPFIDNHYRTQPGPETTGLLGSSLGGLLALYAGLQYGQVFGRIGVLSPALWFNPRVLKLAENHRGYKSRFYVMGSKKESKGMESHLHQIYWALRNAGFAEDRLRVVMRERGRHGERLWGRAFPEMQRWLFG